MKKTILFLFFLPLFSVAQEIVPVLKNEAGLNLFSVTRLERSKGMLDQREISASFNPFSGIYYKRHFGNNAWRASFDYSQKANTKGSAITIQDPAFMGYFISATVKNAAFSVGYERSFGDGKLKPYVFSDLVFNYENNSGMRSEYGCFGPIGIYKFSEERFEYGISAGAGLRYNITPNIHLSLELSGGGFVSVFQDLSNVGYKYVDAGYHMNPVNKSGISISF